MRKLRDYSAELKALDDKARTLKSRKVLQLGSLVELTGADALDLETLAGGLLALTDLSDQARKERLRERGAAFFRKRTRGAARGAAVDPGQPATDNGGSTAQ